MCDAKPQPTQKELVLSSLRNARVDYFKKVFGKSFHFDPMWNTEKVYALARLKVLEGHVFLDGKVRVTKDTIDFFSGLNFNHEGIDIYEEDLRYNIAFWGVVQGIKYSLYHELMSFDDVNDIRRGLGDKSITDEVVSLIRKSQNS